MPQAVWGLQFRGSCLLSNTVNCSSRCCFASNYWGIDWNFTEVLCQAIGESQFAGCGFASSDRGITPVRALLQATGELQFAGFCVVSSYWGVRTCRALFWPKHWRLTISGLLSLRQVEELQFARSCFASSYCGIQLRSSCLVSSYVGITTCRVLLRIKLL